MSNAELALPKFLLLAAIIGACKLMGVVARKVLPLNGKPPRRNGR